MSEFLEMAINGYEKYKNVPYYMLDIQQTKQVKNMKCGALQFLKIWSKIT